MLPMVAPCSRGRYRWTADSTRSDGADPNPSLSIIAARCGDGHFDLSVYDDYLSGRMTDEDVTDERLAAGLATMPTVD